MKSGLYSTFTIQSLQTPPNPRPIKSELLLQPDPTPKTDRLPREVRGSLRDETQDKTSHHISLLLLML